MKKMLVVLLGFALSLVQSCNSDNDLQEMRPTAADQFVASQQFQRMSNEIDIFSDQVLSALSKLSVEERNEVSRVCKELVKSKDQDHKMALANKLNTLTEVDYIGHAKKIAKVSRGIFVGKTFTSQELMKALQKRRVGNMPETKIIVPPEDNRAELEGCLKGCDIALDMSEDSCQQSHGHNPEEMPAEYQMCVLERLAIHTDCMEQCRKMFPILN